MSNTQFKAIWYGNGFAPSGKAGSYSVVMDSDEMNPTIAQGDVVNFSVVSNDFPFCRKDIVMARSSEGIVMRRYCRRDHGLVVTLSDDHTRLGVFHQGEIFGVVNSITRKNGEVVTRNSFRWALHSLLLPLRRGTTIKAIINAGV